MEAGEAGQLLLLGIGEDAVGEHVPGEVLETKTLTLTATDGGSRSYPVESNANWKAGDLVRVTLSGNQIQVTRLPPHVLLLQQDPGETGRIDPKGVIAADIQDLRLPGCWAAPAR